MFVSDVALIVVGCMFIGMLLVLLTLEIATAAREHKKYKEAKEKEKNDRLDMMAEQVDLITKNLLKEHFKDKRD